jgi:hypothetical protein
VTTNPAIWFGVFTETGKLVDVTYGKYYAQEIANELTNEKRVKHVVLPVIITPVTQGA